MSKNILKNYLKQSKKLREKQESLIEQSSNLIEKTYKETGVFLKQLEGNYKNIANIQG